MSDTSSKLTVLEKTTEKAQTMRHLLGRKVSIRNKAGIITQILTCGCAIKFIDSDDTIYVSFTHINKYLLEPKEPTTYALKFYNGINKDPHGYDVIIATDINLSDLDTQHSIKEDLTVTIKGLLKENPVWETGNLIEKACKIVLGENTVVTPVLPSIVVAY